MNISEATRKALTKFPYLEEYISRGIINYRALARAILGDVKKELGRDVNFQSVVTSIRRYPVSMVKKEKRNIQKILSHSEVNLKYDIEAITLRLDREVLRAIDAIRRKSGNLILIQGMETLTIVGGEGISSSLQAPLKEKILDHNSDLASIVVKSPESIVKTPGVIAYLANALALAEINVVEMMSSYTETCFIVEEKDALKAIETIRGEIKRARKLDIFSL
jgi:hypothetical protein